jgi:hypothetical protein
VAMALGSMCHTRGLFLKGMLPKLKSSKYILVYRSSLRIFWNTLVHGGSENNDCVVGRRRGQTSMWECWFKQRDLCSTMMS